MRVFVAGASGTIGMPLVRALAAAGHDVVAMTRSPEKQAALAAAGAVPAVADALDAAAVRRVLLDTRPTHVIHQLTALPKHGPSRASDLAPTNRLRIDGTRHLLEASVAAGVRRMIVGSFAPVAAMQPAAAGPMQEVAQAIESMEAQVLRAPLEGIVLRYGLFYGLDIEATQYMMRLARRRLLPVFGGDRSQLPCIHVSDAVAATVAALSRGEPGATYDIVDDAPVSLSDIVRLTARAAGAPKPFTVPGWIPRMLMPYLASVLAVTLRLSNARARAALGWTPQFRTTEEGMLGARAHAA